MVNHFLLHMHFKDLEEDCENSQFSIKEASDGFFSF